MAKKIRSVKVGVSTTDALKTKTPVLAIGLYEDRKLKSSDVAGELDVLLNGSIKAAFKLETFKGKAGEVFHLLGNSQTKADNILLIGLGKLKEADLETYRKAAAKASSKAFDLKADSVLLSAFDNVSSKLELKSVAQAVCEGAFLGGYRYDEFVTASEDDKKLGDLNVSFAASDENLKEVKQGVKIGAVTGKAQSYARTIANRPANVVTPAELVKEARSLSRKEALLSCKIFDLKQLKEIKAGGILAVGQGSENKPAMIVLKYTPKTSAASSKKVALVGKAVTFDSGGISIKPGAGMDQMKLDKGGGVAVLGAMQAIAQLKPKCTVYGIICAAENMPSGSSYRPGDIVKTMSGKTVEILNTDAEGRMILADGLHYATKQKCDTIVDIATLTGACLVALGESKAGLFGNDDKLIDAIKKASKNTGEAVWHMPCDDEHKEEMKSQIADLRNIGSTRWSGASQAAAFLSSFVGDANWAHLDIAGPGMRDCKKRYGGVGAEAFGVRLLAEFVVNI